MHGTVTIQLGDNGFTVRSQKSAALLVIPYAAVDSVDLEYVAKDVPLVVKVRTVGGRLCSLIIAAEEAMGLVQRVAGTHGVEPPG